MWFLKQRVAELSRITERFRTIPSVSESLQFKPEKDELRYQKNGFTVIAHRGASAYAPENTIPAFKEALLMGADMIELDILPSRDNVPMVLHDPELKRTTNGNGNLKNFTAAELKELDAGYWYSSKFKGVTIPELQEVLEWASGKIAINIEIKPEAVTDSLSGSVTEAALQQVKEFGMEHDVVFSGFDLRMIRQIKEAEPEMICHLLYSRQQIKKNGLIDLLNDYRAVGMNLKSNQLFPRWLDEAKNAGAKLWVYTINDSKQMRYLIKQGVNGIFSDRPDLLRKVADEMLGDAIQK